MKPTQEFIDQILILRRQLRDRQTFAELIDRYQRPLRYFIARLINVPEGSGRQVRPAYAGP